MCESQLESGSQLQQVPGPSYPIVWTVTLSGALGYALPFCLVMLLISLYNAVAEPVVYRDGIATKQV